MDAQTVIGILNVLVPVLTPIVATGVIAVRDRRARRSSSGRRKLVLDDARAQVELFDVWWKARQAVEASAHPGATASPDAERAARQWLDRASQAVAESEFEPAPAEPPLTFRRLALLDGIHSTAGKVMRAVFYGFCGLTVTTIGTTISAMIGPRDATINGIAVSYYVIAGAVIIPMTLAVRFLAVAVERFAVRADDQGRPTHGFLRELFLLRRLQGRGAGWIRALFYLSVLGVTAYIAYSARVVIRFPGLWWLLPATAAGVVVYLAASLGIRTWAASIDRNARRAAARVPRQADGAGEMAEAERVS